MLTKEERKAIAERIGIILNMDNIAFIHPATRTVGLNCVHFDGNGVVELSEQGMNTLKYRIYSDIGRSHNG